MASVTENKKCEESLDSKEDSDDPFWTMMEHQMNLSKKSYNSCWEKISDCCTCGNSKFRHRRDFFLLREKIFQVLLSMCVDVET